MSTSNSVPTYYDSFISFPGISSSLFPCHVTRAESGHVEAPRLGRCRVGQHSVWQDEGSALTPRDDCVDWSFWGICLGGSLVWLFGSIWILSGCCLASLGFICFFFAFNRLVLLNKTCNHSFNTQMLGFPTNSWNLAKGNDIIHVYPPLYLYMESMRYKVVTSPSCPAPDQ